MKVCITCKQEKPTEAFGVLNRPGGKQYLRSVCKVCSANKLREWKKTPEGKEKGREHSRRYMAERKLLADAALAAIRDGLIKDPRK